MKSVKLIFLSTALLLINTITVIAQGCSMCAATIETSANEGSRTGAGLNDGILYLMAFPYVLMGIVGYVWYTKYKQLKK